MSRSLVFLPLALAMSMTLPLLPAQAQSQAQADADSRTAITVLAPRARTTERSGTTGAPIQTITTQSIVYVDDLDLRTPAGRAEMKNRIEVAAKDACSWLDEVYPMAEPPGTGQCTAEAIKRTQDQVNTLLASYGG
ncbi:MAG: UrcA family protein [Novosphingobium sp.]